MGKVKNFFDALQQFWLCRLKMKKNNDLPM